MKPSVYVETTVISYLVGWLNRNDLQVAAHQEITRRWWRNRRLDFDLFASPLVVDEAADGDLTTCWESLMKKLGDPIVEETHRTRTRLLEKYGGSEGYAAHLGELERELADRVVTRKPRNPIKPSGGCSRFRLTVPLNGR